MEEHKDSPTVGLQQTPPDSTLEMQKMFLLNSLVPPALFQGWVVLMAGAETVHLAMACMGVFQTLRILSIHLVDSRNLMDIGKLPLLRTSFSALLRSFTRAPQEK